MTQPETRETTFRRLWRWELWLALILGLVSLAIILLMYGYYEGGIGPAQPIPFSHRLHVGNKRISCLVCHQTVAESDRAGVPAVETCMLCHQQIIITYPPIVRLRAHFENREPLEWNKVYDLPDFVFFSHSLHLHRSVDCERCHGNVAAMDRVARNQDFTMGFCVACHREYEAKTDCYGCHR